MAFMAKGNTYTVSEQPQKKLRQRLFFSRTLGKKKNVHLCRADKLKPDIRIKMSSALFFRYQALNPAAA